MILPTLRMTLSPRSRGASPLQGRCSTAEGAANARASEEHRLTRGRLARWFRRMRTRTTRLRVTPRRNDAVTDLGTGLIAPDGLRVSSRLPTISRSAHVSDEHQPHPK